MRWWRLRHTTMVMAMVVPGHPLLPLQLLWRTRGVTSTPSPHPLVVEMCIMVVEVVVVVVVAVVVAMCIMVVEVLPLHAATMSCAVTTCKETEGCGAES